MKKLILASASPRRREVLSMLEHDFEVILSDADEEFNDNFTIYENIENVAFNKANAVFADNADSVVIGADTVVCLEDQMLFKPADRKDATSMMKRLSGKTHSVITGLCVMDSEKVIKNAVETKVTFKEISNDEIEEYVNTDEPYDKAGGYGIQGSAAKFIKGIEGDYFNVVGMSISALYDMLKEFK